MKLTLATRRSNLAQVQTKFISDMIENRFGYECEKLLIETEGDIKLDVSLDKLGGKGIFVKDIELALLDRRADAAVHSMKDVPFELSEEFEIAAIPFREDVRDAFVSMEGVSFFKLPLGARVGTSSKRRSAQVKLLRPDIEIVPVRGNVESRINKIRTEKMDGIILAAAGLKRLNLERFITDYLDPLVFLPAVGQGALGVEILKGSPNSNVFKELNSTEVSMCVEAERSFMRRLNGGCHTSLGAYSEIKGEDMFMTGIFELNGKLVKKDILGSKWDYIELGKRLGEKILEG